MIWVMSLIIISTIAFVAESMPEFHVRGGPDPTWPEFWDTMETVIVLQFSLEYLARLVVCSSYDASYFVAAARFIIEPMNVVDLVAILPWYLELLGLAGSGSAILRVFRLARVVRIFKLGTYAAGLQMFARTLLASADALLLLVFIISITTILFASMIYYAERGEWSTTNEQWEVTADTPTQFTSIPAAFWWCLVTLTTVGYGDVVPKTLAGMLVAVATMVCGVLTIALPVSIVGSNFQMEYEKLEREKKKRQQAAEAVEASHKVELISPLQQELSKLSELLDEMDGLAKLAAAKQGSIARIANSAVFEQAVTQGA
jgi:voltage-gated potassium channel Kch